MLDLQTIRARAATRASVATPANAANRLIEDAKVSQLATVAKVASPAQSGRRCIDCRHRSTVGTCGEPVAAGLTAEFGIAWPERGHGATCPAWSMVPWQALTAVYIAGAARGWSDTELRAWVADAERDPAAVIDTLRSMP